MTIYNILYALTQALSNIMVMVDAGEIDFNHSAKLELIERPVEHTFPDGTKYNAINTDLKISTRKYTVHEQTIGIKRVK